MRDDRDSRGLVYYLVLNQTYAYGVVINHAPDRLHKSAHRLNNLAHCCYGLITLSDRLDRHACHRSLAIVWLCCSRSLAIVWLGRSRRVITRTVRQLRVAWWLDARLDARLRSVAGWR